MKKILLIIFDGLADRPIPELSGKTPLEVAKTPNLDELAKRGSSGIQNALLKGEYPTSEEAHFEIFGYDHKKELPGRGVLEALGMGAEISKKELALRINFASVDEDLNVVDPRAGNIKDARKFAELISREKIGNFTFKLYYGFAHRAALAISGTPVSKEIRHHSTILTDTDPHKAEDHRGGEKVLKPAPINSSAEAKMTSEALWKYQLLTHKKLDNYVENKVRKRQGLPPVNFLLTRGAGFREKIPSFFEKYNLNAACVAGAPLYKGVAKYFNMDIFEVPGATGDIDTDVSAKVDRSLDLLRSGYDFVFMHLKGADIVAEELGDHEAKMKFFEKADRALGPVLDFEGVVCATGDHATPCIISDHSDDPVPIVIVGRKKDKTAKFDEKSAPKGALGHFQASKIMPKLLEEAGYA